MKQRELILSAAPFQFASKYLEVVTVLRAKCVKGFVALVNFHAISRHQWHPCLTVCSQHHFLFASIHLQSYLNVKGKHKRPIGQCVRTDWREANRLRSRRYDGSACRQILSSRAGRRGYDQSVG